ncbi:hypothetical protein AK88_02497 [Plasmodium fragile]|uniref:Uncharacterized protein n=1 Tax=Plasmodium fragile TaxID=5857 RepID=A0A0D9QLR8_PLAFR|nr:uncharacterized protein AK88_02497 [Plasmodium fragile]KJP87893.1 hypothetical protein AK88_02497 [Plasmodium fragile]
MAPATLVALVAWLSLSQRASSNVIVHPSLTDFFVDSIGDHIFTSFHNVISKRISSPSCSSSADTTCHLVQAGAIGCPAEQTGQEGEDKPIKKKKKKKKKVTYHEQDDEKYTYLHTTPFYASPTEDIFSPGVEWQNEEHGRSGREAVTDKEGRNVWMKGLHFLVDLFTSLTKRKEHQMSTTKKLPPSHFINYNRTNILGEVCEFKEGPTTKYNFKGLFIGEHLNDAQNLSFLSPLSLAVEEIDFNKTFMQAWDVESSSSYVFLNNGDMWRGEKNKKKEDEGSRGGDVAVGRENNTTYLSGEATTAHLNRADGWVGSVNPMVDLAQRLKENAPINKHSTERSKENSTKRTTDGEAHDHTSPPQTNEAQTNEAHTNEVQKKNVTPTTISNIFKTLRIPSETNNCDGMVKINKQMNVGVCTRQSRAGSLFPLLLKKTLISSSPFTKRFKKKEKNHTDHQFTCAFFRSINHCEIVLFFKKSTSPGGAIMGRASHKTNSHEQTQRGTNFITKQVLKLTSNALYKKWAKVNYNKEPVHMVSTNPLKNLTVYKNYEYKKNLFKLHAGYNGISTSVMVVRNYKKKFLLNFIFHVDVCYNELYVNNDIQLRYVNSGVKPALILKGAWSSCALGAPLHSYKHRDGVEAQRVGGVDAEVDGAVDAAADGEVHGEVHGDVADAPPHESPQPETGTGKIYWYKQIFNDKVEPAKRYKRLKALYLQNPRFEENRERTYWMDKLVRESGDVLLLSPKGSVEFKTPVVVSDLYVRLHPNPLYRSSCGESGNSQTTALDQRLTAGTGNGPNNTRSSGHGASVRNDPPPLETCTQGKPYNVHVLFNFYLNKSKKYSSAAEVYVDPLNPATHHQRDNRRHTPGCTNPLNVMTLLQGNISQYRINRIEIEYSLSPHPLVQRDPSIHHTRMPFLISLCNVTLNQSQKVYNYVPTFFVPRGDFLQLLSRIEPNEGDSASTTSTEDNPNRFVNSTSFSIFSSLSESIFWAHIIQFACGVSQCHYDEATERFLVTTSGGRHEGMTQVRQEGGVPYKRPFQPNAHITPAVRDDNTEEGEDSQLSQIQKAYLDFLKRGKPSDGVSDTERATHNNGPEHTTHSDETNEPRPPQLPPQRKEQTVAYDMTSVLHLEHKQKKYLIPPYHKGIYICVESDRNQLVYNPKDLIFYIKKSEKEHVGDDTRDPLPALWIYSALLPTECDLLHFSFLTKNNFTLKMIQTNDTKFYFKNVIPLTRYEDYADVDTHHSEQVVQISFIDLKQNGFTSDFLGLTIDNQLYRAKVIEFLQSKFSTLVQFASEDMSS